VSASTPHRGTLDLLNREDEVIEMGDGTEQQRFCTLKLEVTVEGNTVKCLLETGAEVSCMNEDFFEQNKRRLARYFTADTPLTLSSANQGKLRVAGIVYVPMRVGSKLYRQVFFVVANLNHPLLLGMDILTTARGTIDMASKTTHLGHESTREALCLDWQDGLVVGAVASPDGCHMVRAAQDMVLNPGCAVNIDVTLDPQPRPGLYEFCQRDLTRSGSARASWADGVFEIEGLKRSPACSFSRLKNELLRRRDRADQQKSQHLAV